MPSEAGLNLGLMRIFPRRTPGLQARLAKLEDAHRSLAREHESLKDELAESVSLLTLLGLPGWLHDYIERGRATGWRVNWSPRRIVFHRPEGAEHTFVLSLPLPDDDLALERKRQSLQARITLFEQLAA
jgi:hypothetical protein